MTHECDALSSTHRLESNEEGSTKVTHCLTDDDQGAYEVSIWAARVTMRKVGVIGQCWEKVALEWSI